MAHPDDATWFVDHVRALVAEPDVAVPLRWEEFTVTVEQQAEIFATAAARGDLWLVAEAGGTRVGELNLRRSGRVAFRHSAVLGMSVARAWRNQRVGSLLMQRALEWARRDTTLRRIELFVYATNSVAVRLYERHGFVVEGRRSGAICAGGQFVDDLLMAHSMQREG
jgi:RimJ/RimL family protein N-acetyltransferase